MLNPLRLQPQKQVKDDQRYCCGFDRETGKGAIYLIDGDDSFKK